jgi:hypothetical protein
MQNMHVFNLLTSDLPLLPLLLWETPPGLELILRQEGIAHSRVREPHPLAFRGGRFVLYDSRKVAAATVRAVLSPGHVPLDVDSLRHESGSDPFLALIDTKAAPATWQVGDWSLTERVARVPKAEYRRRLLSRLRRAITEAGGLWARLAPYPYPYRSAFNFRADLDEPVAADYHAFAKARRPLAGCCTHFVSTHAYGDQPEVLGDLLRFDTQSHGHYHVVYRDRESNRRNLQRAHDRLVAAGFRPAGFAAPHGRWNAELDTVIEDLGYLYSSDFQVGYDDYPFFPWRGDRFSNVLQVPIHPVCEGLFLDAGARGGRAIADHLVQTVRGRIAAGEPAFVYGHPERRLGRFPEVLAALHEATTGDSLVWRVTLTEFAEWWHWRDSRRWSVQPRPDGRYEVQFEEWRPGFPLGLEILRGEHASTIPLRGPLTSLRLEDLVYERRERPVYATLPSRVRRPAGLRSAVRKAIDWETVTPFEELPVNTLSARVKKGLRWWREEVKG